MERWKVEDLKNIKRYSKVGESSLRKDESAVIVPTDKMNSFIRMKLDLYVSIMKKELEEDAKKSKEPESFQRRKS